MEPLDFQDMTLDELRPHLAAALPADAAFDGWTATALHSAADRLGVNRDVAALVFPGGPVDMIDGWFAQVDSAMLEALPAETLSAMKIRAKITTLIETRLALLAPHREALRRAQAILANPRHANRTVRLGWRAADVMWRAAGDTATDYNHYTKRMTLSAVYASTMLIFVNDESDDYADTKAFLARRIEGIMRFEKAKAQFTGGGDRHFSMARFLGRLRYPA